MTISHFPSITGVILAGGQARRMDGMDKGLIEYRHQPLVRYAIDALQPQVEKLLINANRNIEHYQQFGFTVINDTLTGFQGPLAGMLSAMLATDSDYILTVPCDCPSITPVLRRRMMETLLASQSDIAVASDGERLQPVFCLIPRKLANELASYLESGERKIDRWLQQYKLAQVDFSDQPHTFINFNEPSDLQQVPTISAPLPMLGFSAFSGTGKTTLLRQLIPELCNRGLRVGVLKHAHHKFEVDIPGKDSYEIRKAGAQQTLIASTRLMALMETPAHTEQDTDPCLTELLPRLDCSKLDLILVEGFKHEAFAKIELHRPSLAKPLLCVDDPNIIAIASDEPLQQTLNIDQLDLNDIPAIADYIQTFMKNRTAN